jgi:hypothetical protein|tara:strand:- start:340 stop:537 length:198 start_codon:yes stop_codon:yes gene_type:complete
MEMLKKPNNPGLKKLPTQVRNKMGYAKKGGAVQSKLKEITAALNKASKMHAAQAKVLASIRKKMK